MYDVDVNGRYDRYQQIERAVVFVNTEVVPGDVLDFGAGCGISTAVLTKAVIANIGNEGKHQRRVVAFDSCKGLPTESEGHGFWKGGMMVTSKEFINTVFVLEKLPPPDLRVGWFEDVLPRTKDIKQCAVAHIDCDIYESTVTVLNFLEPLLQDGSVLLFDDYFCYKGNPNKGEQRAFREFRSKCKTFEFVEWIKYGVHCHSFIAVKE
jgi:hypothetical protein